MKKCFWLWMGVLLITAVISACQRPVDLQTEDSQSDFPAFERPEKGYIRANPLPVGEPIQTANWTVDVLNFARGQEAWEQIKALPYNDEPPGIGEEYVVMQLRASHTNENAEEDAVGISLTGSEGLRYFSFDSDLTGPTPYLNTILPGGESHEGWYTFVIAEGETDLMLVVDDYAILDDPLLYAAVEEGASLLVPDELTAVIPTNRGKDIREPAPFGSIVTNEDWEMTVTDVIIGDEAWDILLEANQFNDPPANDTNYILVKIKVRHIGGGDEPVDMSSYHVRLLNGEHEEYDTPVLVEPVPRFDFDLYPGAEAEGWIAFAGFKDDSGFMLRFNPEYSSNSPEIRYLSLDATGR